MPREIRSGAGRMTIAGIAAVVWLLGAGCSGTLRRIDDGEPPPGRAGDEIAAIEDLLSGHADRYEERQVIDLLGRVDAAELDWIVRHVDLEAMVDSVDDRVFGPDNLTALYDLLGGPRLPDLSVRARAALITALQGGQTDEADEAAIERIALGTTGRDLTALKNAVDAGGDALDLEALLYDDIDDEARRERILSHFAREAVPTGEVKVLSDIDDTLFCSLNDEGYPDDTVYPGVLALYAELDRGPGEPPPSSARDLAFLTARPGFLEGTTHDLLRDLGVGEAVVITGSLLALTSHEAMAERKLLGFDRYRALFPEYGFVFIGDSGQGDAIFGGWIAASHPDIVRAVLIHDVIDTSEPERTAFRERGVLFFDTYLGAALECFSRGLISEDGLIRVAAAAAADLDRISFDDPAQSAARRRDLDRDLSRAAALLPSRAADLPRPGD